MTPPADSWCAFGEVAFKREGVIDSLASQPCYRSEHIDCKNRRQGDGIRYTLLVTGLAMPYISAGATCPGSTLGHLLCLLFSQALKALLSLLFHTTPASQIATGRALPPKEADRIWWSTLPPAPWDTVTASGWQLARQWLMLSAQKGWLMFFHRGEDPQALLALLFPWPKRSPRPISV